MMKKLNSLIQQFPNIFRIIPESKLVKKVLTSKAVFYLATVFALCISLGFIIGITFVSVSIHRNTVIVISEITKKQEIQKQINFWQSVADKYQGYKDAYLQIAVLEYNLGDLGKARQANNKALLLDPNFEDAKKLERLLR
jgi:hypothetical protein